MQAEFALRGGITMGYLKEVLITSVEVKKGGEEGAYEIYAELGAETSDGAGYFGPFQVVLTGEGMEPVTEKTDSTSFSGRVTGWKKDQAYYIKACVEVGSAKVESKETQLLLSGIEGLTAVYKDGCICLTWDKPARNVSQGILHVEAEGGALFAYKPWTKCFRLPLSEFAYKEEQPVYLWMEALDGEGICMGPASDRIIVYLLNPRLTAVESIQKDGADFIIRALCANPYEAAPLLEGVCSLKLCLQDTGGRILTTEAEGYTGTEGVMAFRLMGCGRTLEEIRQACTAFCRLLTPGFVNESRNGCPGIPLGMICGLSSDRRGNTVKASWRYCGTGRPTAYLVKRGAETVRTAEPVWFTEDYSVTQAQDIEVRPVFGEAAGIGGNVHNLFQPCYCVTDSKITFLGELPETDCFVLTYKEEIFYEEKPYREAVEEAPYKLEKTETGYRVTVQPAAEAETGKTASFLRRLEQEGVKPAYLMETGRQLGFGLPHYIGETLACAYGLDAASGSMDIRPGMVLLMEPEIYQFKEDEKDTSSGFLPGAELAYPVRSFINAAGNVGVQVSPFLRRFADWFHIKNQDQTTGAEKGPRYCAGGILDFYQAGMEGPFWKLVYPSVFQGSAVKDTSFPGEHIMLLSCSTLRDMEASMEILGSPIAVLSEIPAAILYIRGRTAVRIGLSVSWRKEKRIVEAGTTLRELFEEESIPEGWICKLVWERLRPDGEKDGYARIQADESCKGRLMDLPLLQGDRIDFE